MKLLKVTDLFLTRPRADTPFKQWQLSGKMSKQLTCCRPLGETQILLTEDMKHCLHQTAGKQHACQK